MIPPKKIKDTNAEDEYALNTMPNETMSSFDRSRLFKTPKRANVDLESDKSSAGNQNLMIELKQNDKVFAVGPALKDRSPSTRFTPKNRPTTTRISPPHRHKITPCAVSTCQIYDRKYAKVRAKYDSSLTRS